MNLSTSSERVDSLLRQSDHIYTDIDRVEYGEPRYRKLVRVGLNLAAISLKQGMTASETGRKIYALNPRGLSKSGPLDTLANQYSDIKRATLDHDDQPESDARHAIHLMRLAVPYALTYYPRLDAGKIASYALIHDLVEAYADDVPSLGMTPEQKLIKDQNEAEALAQMKEDYGEQWPELIELVEKYEELEEPEARFNKTFDKLDPGFTHFHNNGRQLIDHYNYTKDQFLLAIEDGNRSIATYGSDFPLVMEDRRELTSRIADVTFKKAA